MEKLFKIPEITISYSYELEEKIVIRSTIGVAELLTPFYDKFMQHHEEFWVIYLNRGNTVLGIAQIAKGGIATTTLDLRIIFQIALKANATGFILSHNHPSGTLKASESDILLTKRILEAAKLLDLNVIDHVILTKENYYSFVEEGLL